MSATSWQMGANYHDSNSFLKSATSNSSYGQHWFSGSSAATPSLPHYGSLGSRSGRRLGAYTSTAPERYSSVSSKDVHDIVSSGDDSRDKYSNNYVPRYSSANTTPSDYDHRLLSAESDSLYSKRPTQTHLGTSDGLEDLGINDLKLSPRAPGGGTLSPLNKPSMAPSRRYDFLESRSNGSAYDPLKFGLEKSRTSLGLTTGNHTDTDNLSTSNRGNALERSSSFHSAYNPAPPSKPADSIPTWRSRYHTPGQNTSSNLSERPISTYSTTLSAADRPLTINTSQANGDKHGIESPTVHQPSSPLFPNETSTTKATDYKSDLSAASKTPDYKPAFRPSRVLSDAEEETVNNQIAITQTRPMYWLYGSRGRPTTPYKPSSYTYKAEDILSSTSLTAPSRMNENRDVGMGDISRSEYTRDLVSGLPKQNFFSTAPESSTTGDYTSKYSDYSPIQYSPRHGDIRFDTNICNPLPPGSAAKRSILKKVSSYAGAGGQFYHGIGDDPMAHLPPLSSSGRKRVTFNSHQTYHPV